MATVGSSPPPAGWNHRHSDNYNPKIKAKIVFVKNGINDGIKNTELKPLTASVKLIPVLAKYR